MDKAIIAMYDKHFRDGMSFHNSNNFPVAITCFEKALNSFPGDTKIFDSAEILQLYVHSTFMICRCCHLFLKEQADGYIAKEIDEKFDIYWVRLFAYIAHFDDKTQKDLCRKINSWLKENGSSLDAFVSLENIKNKLGLS